MIDKEQTHQIHKLTTIYNGFLLLRRLNLFQTCIEILYDLYNVRFQRMLQCLNGQAARQQKCNHVHVLPTAKIRHEFARLEPQPKQRARTPR